MRYCERCGSAFQWMRTCPRDGVPTRADLDDPLIGSVIGERYRVLERIGAGGMGQVYRAAHVRIASLFAIKVLYGDLAYDEQMRGRFEREAEVASLLQSRHIVRVVDFGESPAGLLYLVMEHLDGHSLADRVARDGAFAPERAVAIARQIARGLAHAHERGVVHRDLKSDNVMLVTEDDEPDVARLLDFGLAQLRTGTKLTRAGQVFGTPLYMAPEQFSGADVDARADLYALGVILYEMLTGAVPFEGASLADLARLHLAEPPAPLAARRPALAAAPPALEAVAQRLLAKSPDERFPSARALLDALRELAASAQLALASSNGGGGADGSPTTPPAASGLPAAAIDAIYNALVVGAPTYNQGDHAGCYEIYRTAAEDVLEGPLALAHHTAAGARLATALRRAAAHENPTDAAWEMRLAFDDLLHAAQSPPAATDPAAGWLAQQIAWLDAVAAPRYAAGDLDILADYYADAVEQLARRARREGAHDAAASLEGVLARVRTGAEEGTRALAALTAAVEAVAAGRALAPAHAAPAAVSQLEHCPRLDEVAQRIVQAIAVGAPAYNQGDHAGCHRVYRQTAEALANALRGEARCDALAQRLRRALAESGALDATSAAWALRNAFDEVLAARARLGH